MATTTLEGSLLDGRWRIARELASGVYGAVDTKTGADVIVRLLDSPWVPSTLLEERRLGALVGHPAFVRLLDVANDPKVPTAFTVAEHAPGETLAALLASGPADLVEAVTIARELLLALDAAHAKGVLLERIPAADVLVRHEPAGIRLKIATRLAEKEPSPAEFDPYTAPERLGHTRSAPTAESAVYRVGALLQHMLTGEPPFEGRDALSLLVAIRDRKPAPIRAELGVPLSVQQAIWRALEKNPLDRFRTARAFADALAL